MGTDQPKTPPIYWETRKGELWFQPPGKAEYLRLESRMMKLQLMNLNFNIEIVGQNGIKAGDAKLLEAVNKNTVAYAGPLAGHKIGLLCLQSGQHVLVTSEAKPIQPAKGKMPRLEAYFDQLFGEQLLYALLWLKVALEALHKGTFRPGQILVLAGPSGCGKSLFQKLVTVLFGGRQGKPYRYMTGGTQFNFELCGAEHLTIEDESAKMDIRSRREFGASIKDFTVNEFTSIHAKGKDATLTLPLFKRCTLSVNDEPENLMILPPLDPSLADKITILKCSRAKFWTDDRDKIWSALTAELPALVYYLRQMRIPKDLQDPRFGVVAYQHPEILEMLTAISPETRMLDFIDAILFAKDDDAPWQGTAAELEKELLGSSSFVWQVQKLLNFSSACGTFLARLETKIPGRFSHNKSAGKTTWTIKKA